LTHLLLQYNSINYEGKEVLNRLHNVKSTLTIEM
jgi:hypothetical protein